MEKETGIEVKTLKLIVESMQRFKLEFETACLANGLTPGDIELARKAVTEMGVTITKKIDDVKKRAVKKKIGDICGNEKELGDILNFINDRESRRFLVTGKENSGKTVTMDEAFNRLNVYHEEVYDIKDFLVKQTYNIRRLLPVIFILDLSGQEKIYLSTKQFKKLLDGKIQNKVIVVCREMDEKMAEKFDFSVEIRSPGFTETRDFLIEKDPELFEGVDDEKAAKIFDECGGMLFNFVRALMAKDYSPDLTKSDFDLAIKLCGMIYKEKDRAKLRCELEKHLKANDKDKSDSIFKVIPYFNFLEHYVVENTYRFFDVTARTFYDVTAILDNIHKNRFYLRMEDIIDYLAFSIPPVESKNSVVLPYIHEYLVYAKSKKAFVKKKKREEDE